MKLRVALILEGIRMAFVRIGEWFGYNYGWVVPVGVVLLVVGIPIFFGLAAEYGFVSALLGLAAIVIPVIVVVLVVKGIIAAFRWAKEYTYQWKMEERNAEWRRANGEA